MINRIAAVVNKEFKHLFRDKRMLFVLIFFPVFLLGIFGYAVNFDVHHIQLAVYDLDKSDVSRDFINSLVNSEYFEISKIITKDEEIKKSLDEKIAQIVLVIPNDFSKNLYSKKESADVQFLIDGVDGNTATIISNYAKAATLSYNAKFQKEALEKIGRSPMLPIDLQPLFQFNPELSTTKFLIPGLIAMILIITAVISVSLSLVREKEHGTADQLKISSLSTLEIIIGKTTPYILIALLDAVFILIAGYILFNVEVKGSYLLLFLSTFLFILASTSLGIFISVISDTQQLAFTFATMASLLPSVILSGFIFPIESMPFAIQLLTNITPAKFFIVILRAIILRGVGLQAFWTQLIYLILFAILFLVLATVIGNHKAKSA
jgi:ABC-2 type transport system permease protein